MDDTDLSDERIAVAIDAEVEARRNAAAAMPKGNAGVCYQCGEDSLRLVLGACAKCRDEYGLP